MNSFFGGKPICSANFSAIADGSITDDSFLAILYELDSRDKWMEPNAWMKAKPSLGAINWRNDITSSHVICFGGVLWNITRVDTLRR